MTRVDTSTHSEIGQRIRAARQEMKLSQTELGTAIGVTFQQIQKYEQGKNRCDVDYLKTIAAKLDKPLSYFIGPEYNSAVTGGNGLAAEFFASADGAAIARIFVKADSRTRKQMRRAIEGIAEA